jgi:MscS family membrane protein
VEKIGLRSTRIRTEQKTLVTVPNKQMVDSILDNLTLRIQRRGELKLELDPSAPVNKIETLVESLRTLLKRDEVEDSHVYLADISGQSIIINLDYFTAPVTVNEFSGIRQEINLQVLKLMEQMEIHIAGTNAGIRFMEIPKQGPALSG